MKIDEWIILGRTGASSKAMWAAIKGVVNKLNQTRFSVPGDRTDFKRCYDFYTQCNLNYSDLQKIKEALPRWVPFIDNWDKLVKMYEAGEPMGDYLFELDKQGRLNAGWVEVSPGRWQVPALEK